MYATCRYLARHERCLVEGDVVRPQKYSLAITHVVPVSQQLASVLARARAHGAVRHERPPRKLRGLLGSEGFEPFARHRLRDHGNGHLLAGPHVDENRRFLARAPLENLSRRHHRQVRRRKPLDRARGVVARTRHGADTITSWISGGFRNCCSTGISARLLFMMPVSTRARAAGSRRWAWARPRARRVARRSSW